MLRETEVPAPTRPFNGTETFTQTQDWSATGEFTASAAFSPYGAPGPSSSFPQADEQGHSGKFPLELVIGVAAAFLVLCLAIALFLFCRHHRASEYTVTQNDVTLDWSTDADGALAGGDLTLADPMAEVTMYTGDLTLAAPMTEAAMSAGDVGPGHINDLSEGIALAAEFL